MWGAAVAAFAVAILVCGAASHPRRHGPPVYVPLPDLTPEETPAFKCGYSGLPPLRTSLAPQKYVSSKRSGNTWQPIRISVVTDYLAWGVDPYACKNKSLSTSSGWVCTSSDVLTDAKREYIIGTMMTRAVAFIEAAYSVIRVQGNLTLTSSTCSMYSTQPVTVSQKVWPDTDLVIFVTARPLDESYLALAAECMHDTKKRAVAGHININPNSLVVSAKAAAQVVRDQEQTKTAIHELHHVLGFNHDKFSVFWDPESESQLPYSALITTTREYNGISHSIVAVNSTLVVQAARILSGCSTLQYVPMEDGGGSGTEKDHWEKRIAMNEFITGTVGRNPVVSNLTLALMQDTGWYRANFSMAEDLLWTAGRGCSFVTDACDVTEDIFCTVESYQDCTWDRLASGKCNYGTISAGVPLYDQYFNSSTLGGSDTLADYCPYIAMYTSLDCRYSEGLTQSGFNFGSLGGTTSRCFRSSLVYGDAYRDYSGSCHPVQCLTSGIAVRINYNWYECPWGDEIEAAGFNGTLKCPSQSERSKLCTGSVVSSWPTLDDINPKEGGSGTKIYVTGTNFVDPMVINIGGYDCESVVVHNSTYMTAKLPSIAIDTSTFVSEATYVIVNTSEGYTAVELSAFTITKGLLSDAVLKKILEWLKANPIVLAIVAVAIFAVIAITAFLIIRRNMSRKQAIADAEAAREAAAAKRMRKRLKKKNRRGSLTVQPAPPV